MVKAKKDKPTAEEMFRDAVQLMRDAYAAHYRGIGDEFMERVRSGDEFTTADGADEWLRQTIDGDGWVIYTQQAQAVCLCSENDGAYESEFGADGIVEDGVIQWSRLAYCALMADVVDYLGAHGVCVTDPETWKDAE